jgi:predicted PurR-regulated permease PerM
VNDQPRPGADRSTQEPAEPRVVVRRIEIEGHTVWYVIGAILLTIALLWAVQEASSIVSMVLISFFFSLALDPGVRRLTERYEMRRGTATGIIYVVGALFVTLMVVVLIPALVELANVVAERGAEWIASVNGWTMDTFNWELSSEANAAELADTTGDAIGDFAKNAFGTVVGIASTGIGLVFSFFTIAMFTFYLTAEAPAVKRAVLGLFSPAVQERIGWTWDQAIVQTGGYFYSRMILMFINGLGFFFTMLAVGMPLSLSASLALFGSFVSVFIPAIGTYIGGAIPILVTLAVQGLTEAIIVLAYVLIYQQVENYFLSPKISANTMTLNGGVAFGAALAGGAIAGPMGAFTALPVAALISSFASNYLASHEVVYESPEPQERTKKSKHRDEDD